MLKKYILIILITMICLSGQAAAEVYSTWDTLEPDKCASAWLLKRFVDKEAEFKFYPKGELISSGIPFDTPDAELRRYHNISTFESILRKYKLDDPVLMDIGIILHDIEVNFWGKKQRKESPEIEKSINEIVSNNSNTDRILAMSFKIFDNLYKKLKGENHDNK